MTKNVPGSWDLDRYLRSHKKMYYNNHDASSHHSDKKPWRSGGSHSLSDVKLKCCSLCRIQKTLMMLHCLLVSAGKEHIYLLLKELLSNSDIHVVFSAPSSNMSHITNDAKTTLGFVTLLKVVRFACHLTALVQDLPQHV